MRRWIREYIAQSFQNVRILLAPLKSAIQGRYDPSMAKFSPARASHVLTGYRHSRKNAPFGPDTILAHTA